MITVTLRPRQIGRGLTVAIALLVVASVAAQIVRHHSTHTEVRAVAQLFRVSVDRSIPAYASAAMLLASAGLLWLIARGAAQNGRSFVRHWGWLAVIFAYLSVDEAVSIHELSVKPMQRLLGGHGVGFLYYAWVVPGAVIVLGVGLVYLRFLLHLPVVVRNRVIAAGLLYVGGALGMEMVGSYYADTIGAGSIRYALAALIEETMEMLGVVVFIHALLLHLGGGSAVRVLVEKATAQPLVSPIAPAPLAMSSADGGTL